MASLERSVGRRLEPLLEALTDQEALYLRRGRRIAPRRLHLVAQKRLDVFEHRSESEGIDTAVGILADMSGSMFAEKAVASTCGALGFALGRAIARFEVPCAVGYFGSQYASVLEIDGRWTHGRRPWVCDLGGTELLVPAVEYAQMLSLREEARKLLVVITDGDPNRAQESAAALATAEMLGVEVVTFFIGSGGGSFEALLTDVGLRVHRLPMERAVDLPSLVTEAFKSALTKGRMSRARAA
jgi:cobaltochelatase CobT